jgi:hypothetical protein
MRAYVVDLKGLALKFSKIWNPQLMNITGSLHLPAGSQLGHLQQSPCSLLAHAAEIKQQLCIEPRVP